MPIHDWSRTYAMLFHALHVAWIGELQRALNAGLLPEGYYALGEQVVGGAVPEVLTRECSPKKARPWRDTETEEGPAAFSPSAPPVAVASEPTYPPRPRV